MARASLQMEFQWTSWLKRLRKKPARRPVLQREDGGLTAWCVDACADLGLPELARRVRVCWNPRMQTTAGRAWWPDRLIELNPKLHDFGSEELWRTLKHELAHLVAYERCGRRRIDAHGPEWDLACADLGIAGESPYHTLPLKRRRLKRKHIYNCPNCEVVIKRVRPINRPVACYECCRKFSSGTYDQRFRLIKRAPAA